MSTISRKRDAVGLPEESGSGAGNSSVGVYERGRTPLPHVPGIVPILNNVTRFFLRLGLPMGPMTLLEVPGRKTGKMHRQPIGMFMKDGRRFLFSTFGDTNWVRNLRAAHGQASIGSRRKHERVIAVELSADNAASVIKEAVAPSLSNPFAAAILGPHMNALPDAPLEEFLGEAERHPVFELRPVSGDVA